MQGVGNLNLFYERDSEIYGRMIGSGMGLQGDQCQCVLGFLNHLHKFVHPQELKLLVLAMPEAQFRAFVRYAKRVIQFLLSVANSNPRRVVIEEICQELVPFPSISKKVVSDIRFDLEAFRTSINHYVHVIGPIIFRGIPAPAYMIALRNNFDCMYDRDDKRHLPTSHHYIMSKDPARMTKIHLVGVRVLAALHGEPLSLDDIQGHFTNDGFSEVRMCTVGIFYWGLGGAEEVRITLTVAGVFDTTKYTGLQLINGGILEVQELRDPANDVWCFLVGDGVRQLSYAQMKEHFTRLFAERGVLSINFSRDVAHVFFDSLALLHHLLGNNVAAPITIADQLITATLSPF